MSLLAARMLCGDLGKTPPPFGAVPSGPVVEVSLLRPEMEVERTGNVAKVWGQRQAGRQNHSLQGTGDIRLLATV